MVRYDTAELNNIPFGSVVERYGKVWRRGSSLMAICPWHDDHNPSLLVGGKNNRCKCMVCDGGGSVIDYVMAKENVDFKGACELLSRDFSPSQSFGQLPPFRGSKAMRKDLLSKKKKVARSSLSLEAIKASLVKKKVKMPEKRYEFIPTEFMLQHVSADNTFCECLSSLWDDDAIRYVTDLYKLGAYTLGQKSGYVMFPSIDIKGRVHNIKIQRYCTDKDSERFFHKEDRSTYWLGSMLKKQLGMAEDAEFDCTCFFGEHLLAWFPEDTVALVESPKNAVIGFLAMPKLNWIAVGNKSNINRERMEVLRGRKVIVLPDADAVQEWKEKLEGMKDIATFEFSSFCDVALGECGKKGDVADYIIKKTASP